MSSKGASGGHVADHVNKRQRLLTEVSVSDDEENTSGNAGNNSGASSATPRMWERFLGEGEDRGCIALVEHFDVGLLQHIMAAHKGKIFKESIQQANTMMERVDKKGGLQVTYEQANYKSFDPDGNFKGSYSLGRYCARHGGSMQGMKRVIRNTIAYESYHDIDMANAHPNFAAQLFHHLPIPTYLAYASDRQHFIEAFTSATGLGGSYCKQIVASIMNGSYLFGITDKDWKEMVSSPTSSRAWRGMAFLP